MPPIIPLAERPATATPQVLAPPVAEGETGGELTAIQVACSDKRLLEGICQAADIAARALAGVKVKQAAQAQVLADEGQ